MICNVPDFGPEADKAVREAMQKFPPTFGLRAYPGQTFRIGESASYVSSGRVMLYTQRQFTPAKYLEVYGKAHSDERDLWVDFAKGTVEELRSQVVPIG